MQALAGHWLLSACGVVYAGGLVVAAGWDLASYTIPNRVVAVVALAALTALALTAPGFPAIGQALAVGLTVLVVGALLFAIGVWGAGDAKLLAAAAIPIGPQGALSLIAWVAVIGGVLSLILLLTRRLVRMAGLTVRLPDLLSAGQGVPYGVAISAGALGMQIMHRTLFSSFFFP